jgi:hypothetical protein
MIYIFPSNRTQEPQGDGGGGDNKRFCTHRLDALPPQPFRT